MGEYGWPADALSRDQVNELSEWIKPELVDLETGEYNNELNIDDYELSDVLKNNDTRVQIVDPEFDPGEPYRPKVAKIYVVRRPQRKANSPGCPAGLRQGAVGHAVGLFVR